ncbi:MAG: hypothetical protein KAR42_17740 [candidate division Zixibacteria bacterium]|nr:hypothetical protein [candidate division Zixibacteria bacterium]
MKLTKDQDAYIDEHEGNVMPIHNFILGCLRRLNEPEPVKVPKWRQYGVTEQLEVIAKGSKSDIIRLQPKDAHIILTACGIPHKEPEEMEPTKLSSDGPERIEEWGFYGLRIIDEKNKQTIWLVRDQLEKAGELIMRKHAKNEAEASGK